MVIDVLIAIFAIAFAILGFFKGVVIQLFGLAGLVLAFLLAPVTGPLIIEWAHQMTKWEILTLSMASKVGILCAGTLIYSVIFSIGLRMHKKLIEKRPIVGWMDKMAGAFLGLIKGAVIIMLIGAVIQDKMPHF